MPPHPFPCLFFVFWPKSRSSFGRVEEGVLIGSRIPKTEVLLSNRLSCIRRGVALRKTRC